MSTIKYKHIEAAEYLLNSKYTIATTGAGISVESGIPPFRGQGGLWSKYDPIVLDLDYYYSNTIDSWKVVKKLFFDFFGSAIPNEAHKVLARFEENGILNCVITQNIDNLHYEAGSKNIIEYHGNSRQMVCMKCSDYFEVKSLVLTQDPPKCPTCSGLLKPDFIFFGEAIPQSAANQSVIEAKKADVVLLIGTTGEVMPASFIPEIAKSSGAKIIEINPIPSRFTNKLTDIYIPQKASEALLMIESIILNK
jgi:NAD-dependent deacetylase